MARVPRVSPGAILLLAIVAWSGSTASSQERAASSRSDKSNGFFDAALRNTIEGELRKYAADGKAILISPLHWDTASWATFASVAASVAALSTQDERIDIALQRRRSAGTDSLSRAVTPLGSYAGIGVSVLSLGAGLLTHSDTLRDAGRDAIEAEIFAAGIVTPLLKTAVGRTRPAQGGDGDEYRPLSSRQSFPSGHATEAFAVASVIAARSPGWVVPTLAYSLASAVAFARMNDRAHFASDVVAGAVIGTAIGRSIVSRHIGQNAASFNLVPISSRGGFGVGLRLATCTAPRPDITSSPAPEHP